MMILFEYFKLKLFNSQVLNSKCLFLFKSSNEVFKSVCHLVCVVLEEEGKFLWKIKFFLNGEDRFKELTNTKL